MAPVPNLDLMKKGLRLDEEIVPPIEVELSNGSSKPRPDEEGIETLQAGGWGQTVNT